MVNANILAATVAPVACIVEAARKYLRHWIYNYFSFFPLQTTFCFSHKINVTGIPSRRYNGILQKSFLEEGFLYHFRLGGVGNGLSQVPFDKQEF